MNSEMKEDKLKHFIAGVLIALLLSIAHPYAGLAGAIVIGLLKEIWDGITKRRFELLDWLATGLGGVAVFLCDLLKHLNGEWGF